MFVKSNGTTLYLGTEEVLLGNILSLISYFLLQASNAVISLRNKAEVEDHSALEGRSQECDDLKKEITSLKGTLEKRDKDLVDMNDEVEDMAKRMTKALEERDRARREKAQLEVRLAEVNKSAREDKAELDQLRAQVKEMETDRTKLDEAAVLRFKNSEEYNSVITAYLDFYDLGRSQVLRVLAATGKYTAQELARIGAILSTDSECWPCHALVPLCQDEIDSIQVQWEKDGLSPWIPPQLVQPTVQAILAMVEDRRFDDEAPPATLAQIFAELLGIKDNNEGEVWAEGIEGAVDPH